MKKTLKEAIHEKYRTSVGLCVDEVRPGAGTSNDGNTSRRFFSDVELALDILGVDGDLIRRFGIILDVMNSSRRIDIPKFANYCRETAQLYVDLYPWYPMPNTVHKVLVHADKIFAEVVLPIGLFSEEAQEALNKVIRRRRNYHARKMSRENTNEDVFRGMLELSDPGINVFRNKPRVSGELVNNEATQFFKTD